MAKPLANGFPIGATMVSNAIAEEIRVGDHGNSLGFTDSGTTFGGNPLAAQLAHHVFQRISSAEMLTQIHTTSSLFQKYFSYLKQSFPDLIEEVRGLGLILGVQLKAVGGKTASDIAGLVVKHAREKGLLVITAGEGTIRFVPPLNIPEETVSEGLIILEEAMRDVQKKI
jgi:acetylornithine aminotransferase